MSQIKLTDDPSWVKSEDSLPENGLGWYKMEWDDHTAEQHAAKIDHPNHYTNKSVECWDWIEQILTPEEFRGGLKFAALKYIYRMDSKGDPQDNCEKARAFLRRLKKAYEQR